MMGTFNCDLGVFISISWEYTGIYGGFMTLVFFPQITIIGNNDLTTMVINLMSMGISGS